MYCGTVPFTQSAWINTESYQEASSGKDCGLDKETSSMPDDKPQFERDEDFTALYANHVWFELSAWDVNMIFGQLDQSKGPSVVRQHTGMAVSWLQAKVMHHFLEINLAVHEAEQGQIKIPRNVLPPPIQPVDPSSDPAAVALNEKVREIRDRFIAENS
jgi:hypothetical protein